MHRPVYKRLLSYLRPLLPWFITAIIANILYSLVDAMLIKLLEPLIDEGFIHRNSSIIMMIPLLVPLLFLIRGATNFISTYFMGKVGRTVVMRIRQQLFEHYLYLPLKYLNQLTSGSALSKIIYNVDQVANASTQSITDLVRESSLLVGLIAVMFSNSWRLTLILLTVAPLIWLMINYVSRRSRKLCKKTQSAMEQLTSQADQALSCIKIIKLFFGYRQEVNKFNNILSEVNHQECKLIFTTAISSPIIQLLGGISLTLIIFFALHQTNISAGAFTSIATCLIALLRPLKRLSAVNVNIQRGIAGAESVFEILDQPKEASETNNIITSAVTSGDIEYRQVSFSYPGIAGADPQLALKNIHLTINQGETVALVGESGSGKSTFISLLPRFYDDYLGRILINGQDIRSWSLKQLRQQIAMVDQHVLLFDDTIVNNISYGLEQNEDKLNVAVKLARVDEFVNNYPLGLQTMIGENGMNLSGGQRQRIAIARAIYKESPIIIFDEATSALDNISEREIQQSLKSLHGKKTIIIIAHRMSTIRDADNIIVFKKGSILEVGTHAQLVSNNHQYAKLHDLQI